MQAPLRLLTGLLSFYAIGVPAQNPDWLVVKPKTGHGVTLEALCAQPGQETGIVARGDFDGNGKSDTAKLEQNRKQNKQRLVVYFDDKPTPFVIEEKSPKFSGDYLRTKKGKSGFDQISYGSCRASEVLLTWDPKAKKFTENWISD